MIADTIPALSRLSSDDKIILAAELWSQAIRSAPEAPDPEMVTALQERLNHFYDHPESGSTWHDVRTRIQNTSRR